jgi:hypothetical protein
MFIDIGYFFLLRSQDQTVIPMRMTDTASQMTKEAAGKAPVFAVILMNAIIPVTTTTIVRISGILSDSCIFLLRKMTTLVGYPIFTSLGGLYS